MASVQVYDKATIDKKLKNLGGNGTLLYECDFPVETDGLYDIDSISFIDLRKNYQYIEIYYMDGITFTCFSIKVDTRYLIENRVISLNFTIEPDDNFVTGAKIMNFHNDIFRVISCRFVYFHGSSFQIENENQICITKIVGYK